jgi:hypothetical protein
MAARWLVRQRPRLRPQAAASRKPRRQHPLRRRVLRLVE